MEHVTIMYLICISIQGNEEEMNRRLAIMGKSTKLIISDIIGSHS